MKITPLDIYNKEFTRKFSIRSYDEKEVDEFLDHVAAAYERLYKELNQIKDENDRLKSDLAKYQQMERTLQETMVVAQETVKDRKEHAEREALMIVEVAKNRAREIVNEAKDQVKERLKQVSQLQEYERFFRVRFKALMDSHLQLLESSDMELPTQLEDLTQELAFSGEEPMEEDVHTWVEEMAAKKLLFDDGDE